MNSLGILCSDTSAFVTSYAYLSAIIVSSVGTNFAALVSWFTITRIVSQNRADPGSNDLGSFTMKSIVTLVYGLDGGCRGCNRP